MMLVVKLDRGQLPKDVIHRGYREVTIQNIVFKTDNVLYRLERLYSASLVINDNTISCYLNKYLYKCRNRVYLIPTSDTPLIFCQIRVCF